MITQRSEIEAARRRVPLREPRATGMARLTTRIRCGLTPESAGSPPKRWWRDSKLLRG